MEAAVAICKCSSSKRLYGIRFESVGKNTWEYTWAFTIIESMAMQEGYDQTIIQGNLIEGQEYPGCTHCGAKGFFYCSCGHLNCWNRSKRIAKCLWCGATGELSEGIAKIEVSNNI